MPKQRRPDQRLVLVHQSPFSGPRQQRRSLEPPIGMFCLLNCVDDPYSLSARSAVGLQDRRKTHSGDPCFEVMSVANNFGSRSANAVFLRQLHESSSGIHDGETFRCAERTLDELANRGSRSPLTFFSAIEVVQVPSGEVVTWQYEVWLCGGDRVHK